MWQKYTNKYINLIRFYNFTVQFLNECQVPTYKQGHELLSNSTLREYAGFTMLYGQKVEHNKEASKEGSRSDGRFGCY